MNYVVLLEKFRDFYGCIDWKFCFLTFFQKIPARRRPAAALLN